ncbi:hypothetical protein [Citrobacter freundii]|uniref:hypothetical protein n=1 Tax=Citrobacter freundii TaxID=546 RepID=UPI003FA03593
MGVNNEIVEMAACYAAIFENIKLENDMDWPKEYSKTTQEKRDAAYKLYDVEAITRSVLLPGQVKTAYHGRPITTDYYLFLFTSRANSNLTGYFTCGLRAAGGWFKLNGQRPEDIASYNPLTGESTGGGKTSGSGVTRSLKEESNPRMKRLIRVLQTFISLTDDEKRKIKGESKTLTVLQKLIKASKNAPTTSNIRSVNTILYKALKDGRHGGAHTFTQLVKHYEELLGVTFKKIDTDDFNQEIDDTRNKSATYPYIPLASF